MYIFPIQFVVVSLIACGRNIFESSWSNWSQTSSIKSSTLIPLVRAYLFSTSFASHMSSMVVSVEKKPDAVSVALFMCAERALTTDSSSVSEWFLYDVSGSRTLGAKVAFLDDLDDVRLPSQPRFGVIGGVVSSDMLRKTERPRVRLDRDIRSGVGSGAE